MSHPFRSQLVTSRAYPVLLLEGIIGHRERHQLLRLLTWLVWLLVAIFLMVGISLLNLKSIFSYRWAILGIYFAVLVLLMLVFAFPPRANIQAWITFGDFQVQPSEFMKLGLIILLSSYFGNGQFVVGHS